MATEKQLIKLEKIKRVTDKTSNKQIPKALSRGRLGYERAIKSVMNLGQWAVVASIISVAAAALFLFIRWYTHYGILRDYEIIIPIVCIVCSIISGVLGYKLWNLEATPIFALISMLVILVCNTLTVFGILPLIVVIVDVIALCRYSTFCSWFHGIK